MSEDEVGTHTESICWMKGRLKNGVGESKKEYGKGKHKEKEEKLSVFNLIYESQI